MFGVHASPLIHGAKQAEDLQDAVDGRDVIGQAEGLLMERSPSPAARPSRCSWSPRSAPG